jgi:hypothetical protein
MPWRLLQAAILAGTLALAGCQREEPTGATRRGVGRPSLPTLDAKPSTARSP